MGLVLILLVCCRRVWLLCLVVENGFVGGWVDGLIFMVYVFCFGLWVCWMVGVCGGFVWCFVVEFVCCWVVVVWVVLVVVCCCVGLWVFYRLCILRCCVCYDGFVRWRLDGVGVGCCLIAAFVVCLWLGCFGLCIVWFMIVVFVVWIVCCLVVL